MSGWWVDLLKNGGLAGLVAIGVIYIYIGRLLPKNSVDERIKDLKDRIDFLEKALESEKSINNVNSQSLRQLLSYAESSDKLLDALYSATQSFRRDAS